MLLIEGPDLIGKTTLCKAIMHRHGSNLFKGQTKFGLAERSDMMSAVRSRVLPGILCDRSWVSEVVYSAALKRPSCVGLEDMLEAAEIFAKAGGMLVVIHATKSAYTDILRERWRDEEAFTKAQCAVVNAAYDPFAMAALPLVGAWVPHVDFHAAITKSDQFPGANDKLVDSIALEYAKRQRALVPPPTFRLAE